MGASEVGPAWRCRKKTDRVKTCEVRLAVFQAPTQSDIAATAESSVA